MSSSIKFSDALKPLSDKFSLFKLPDDTLRAIQAIKSWDLNLEKGIERIEDSNLSTDFEPKEIDEKDCQKEK